ncbi:HAD family phosphatase [Rhodobacterales bacterium]|nr:HAD family phosphatase [Rhodobacterales bacterium]
MNASTIRAVIFDFDGVLVNSEIIALHELRACLAEIGISVPQEEMTSSFLGSSFEDVAAFIRRRQPEIDTEAFRKTWYDRLFSRYESELAIMSGAQELLDILAKRGLPHCIASGGSYRRLNFALNVTGLAGAFQNCAFSADSVTRGKPEPDVFLYAAEQLGIPVEQCLVIEDAVAGVTAARRAGMHVIGYTGGDHLADIRDIHSEMLTTAGAYTVADDLLQIPDLMSLA